MSLKYKVEEMEAELVKNKTTIERQSKDIEDLKALVAELRAANKPAAKNGKSKAKAGAKKDVKSPKSIKLDITKGTGNKQNGVEIKFSADPRGHKNWEQSKDLLKEKGFHWNPKKECWYAYLLDRSGDEIPGVMDTVEKVKSLLQ